MSELYKVLSCDDYQCSRVGFSDTEVSSGLSMSSAIREVNELRKNGINAWFVEQCRDCAIDDLGCAYLINEMIDRESLANIPYL